MYCHSWSISGDVFLEIIPSSRYKIGHNLTYVLITDFIVLGHLLEVILRRRT